MASRWQRFVRFPLTRLVIGLVWISVPFAALQIVREEAGLQFAGAASALLALAIAATSAAAYISYVRVVERRRVDELARDGAVRQVALGIAIGVAAFSTTMLAICLTASCTIGAGDGASVMLATLAWAISAGVFEELAFRGIVFRIIEDGLGTWAALAISAAVFGLLHGFNPNATITSSAAIALEAGILLAAGFIYTRRLWLPIGMHLAWNFTESGVFGATVSGHSIGGIAATRTAGPELITGGEFGPEASIIAVVVCVSVAVTLLVLAHRRGRFIAPMWRRR